MLRVEGLDPDLRRSIRTTIPSDSSPGNQRARRAHATRRRDVREKLLPLAFSLSRFLCARHHHLCFRLAFLFLGTSLRGHLSLREFSMGSFAAWRADLTNGQGCRCFSAVKENTHGQRKRGDFDSEIRIPNVSQTPRASWRRVLFLKRTHSPRMELFAGNTREKPTELSRNFSNQYSRWVKVTRLVRFNGESRLTDATRI